MKKNVLLVAIIATMFYSCSNEVEKMSDDSMSIEESSEQMLSFQSEEEFENTVSLLKNMEKQDQKEWIKMRDESFYSL